MRTVRTRCEGLFLIMRTRHFTMKLRHLLAQHDGVTPNHHIQKLPMINPPTVASMGIAAGYC